jgi:hypothetical protein
MATDTLCSIGQIGDAAGQIWHHLDAKGPKSLAKLIKETEIPRDLLMQALGWLAREDKINIDADSRSRTVSLRENGR